MLLPALLLGLPGAAPVQVLATNKLAAICGTTVSSVTYYRRVRPDPRTFLPLMAFSFAGALLGGVAATWIPVEAFDPIVLVVLVVVGGYVLLKPDLGERTALRFTGHRHLVFAMVTGLAIGFYDGALGPGTGSFFVFTLVGLLGYSFLEASAKARLANWTTNLGALVIFVPMGAVLWKVGLVMGACNLLGGYLGARVAISRGSRLRAGRLRARRLRLRRPHRRRPAGGVVTGYLVPARPGRAEIEVKRSRFVADVRRVADEAAVRDLVDELRRTRPDAGHHCSACVIGPDRALERSSDDGEPAGTAGAPMLEVLRGSGLSDVAVVVTRWFGGTLLGAGGLVRAYGDAARAALDGAGSLRRELLHELTVVLPHADAGRVESELRSRGATVLDTSYDAEVTLVLGLADPVLLDGWLAELTGGRVSARPSGERWVDRAGG